MKYKNSRQYNFRAKELRKQAPRTEQLVWNALRELRKETILKFRRQHPLSPYVADFACVAARLIVELDGDSHDGRQSYDARRDADLKDRGWHILRIKNDDVFSNLEGVIETILKTAQERLPQTSGPPLTPPASGRGSRPI